MLRHGCSRRKLRAAIVGQSFNTSRDGRDASLDEWGGAFKDPPGRSTDVILDWMNVSYVKFDRLFDTFNIINRRGEHIPDDLMKDIMGYDVVVIMGGIAAREMLGMKNISTAPVRVDDRFYVLPHPSGRNRVLNDPFVREACGKLCRQIIRRLSS